RSVGTALAAARVLRPFTERAYLRGCRFDVSPSELVAMSRARTPRARSEDVPLAVEFRGGRPGVTVLARRISAPRPARTISIITRSRFERSCRWRACDRRRVAIWWKCDRSRLKLFSVDFLPCRQR